MSSTFLRNLLSFLMCFSCSCLSGGNSLSRGYPSGTGFTSQEDTGSWSLSGSNGLSISLWMADRLKPWPWSLCNFALNAGFVAAGLLSEHPIAARRQMLTVNYWQLKDAAACIHMNWSKNGNIKCINASSSRMSSFYLVKSCSISRHKSFQLFSLE